MRVTVYIYFWGWVLLSAAGGGNRLDARDRMQYYPLLIPVDPGYVLTESLEGTTLLTASELDQLWRKKRADPINDKTSWVGLALNFWVQQDFHKALNCLRRARPNAREEVVQMLKRFEPWLDEQAGNFETAEYAWRRLSSRHDDQPELLTRYFSCLLLQRKFGAAEEELPSLNENNPNHQLLRAIYFFAQGDTFSSRYMFQEIADRPDAPAEAFLGLALLSTVDGAREDTLGWLRQAITLAVPRDRIRFTNLSAFTSLHEDPRFQHMLQDYDIPLYPGSVPEDVLESFPTSAIAHYIEKHRIPETMLINLRMRIHEPSRKVGGDVLPFDRAPSLSKRRGG